MLTNVEKILIKLYHDIEYTFEYNIEYNIRYNIINNMMKNVYGIDYKKIILYLINNSNEKETFDVLIEDMKDEKYKDFLVSIVNYPIDTTDVKRYIQKYFGYNNISTINLIIFILYKLELNTEYNMRIFDTLFDYKYLSTMLAKFNKIGYIKMIDKTKFIIKMYPPKNLKTSEMMNKNKMKILIREAKINNILL